MFKLDTFLLLSPFHKQLDGLHPFSGKVYREDYFSNNTSETIVRE